MSVNVAVTDTAWSPNHSAGRPAGPPDSITIHHWGVDGQQHQTVVDYLCRHDGTSSAHYVASSGRVTQLVHDSDRAWHAGPSGNPRSIGIECRPEMSSGDFETVARLIAAIRAEWGHLPLVGHRQWMATDCPGRWFARLGDLSARADQIASGAPPTQEDDMPTAAEVAKAVWDYQIGQDGTSGKDNQPAWVRLSWAHADGANNRETLATVLQRAGSASDSVTPGIAGVKFDGDLYSLVKAQAAQLTALSAAVTALSTANGIDGPAITQAIADAVHEALAGLEVTLATKETD